MYLYVFVFLLFYCLPQMSRTLSTHVVDRRTRRETQSLLHRPRHLRFRHFQAADPEGGGIQTHNKVPPTHKTSLGSDVMSLSSGICYRFSLLFSVKTSEASSNADVWMRRWRQDVRSTFLVFKGCRLSGKIWEASQHAFGRWFRSLSEMVLSV